MSIAIKLRPCAGIRAAVSWIGRYFSIRAVMARLGRLMVYAVIAAHAALFLLILTASLALTHWNPPFSSLMIYRGITTHQAPEPLRFVPHDKIPRTMRDMAVRLEDGNFYVHWGIDLAAIRYAFRVNKAVGYTVSGGSTIPQQLARTLFLTPRKTYFRKYVEALIAVEMDLLLSKRRLLELYLNNIEWGKGVYGIGAASLEFYGRLPADLSIDELRRLATILPNPLKYGVYDFSRSGEMAGRYTYLVERFPDPADALPMPSASDTESSADASRRAPGGALTPL
jgi:monofunctional biosynthetic peptidoglycan transglycosylase